MSEVLFVLLLIVFSIDFWIYLSSNIHIFQLNHYKPKSQITWIKRNISKILFKSIIYIFILLLLMFSNDICTIISIILFIINMYIHRPRKSKKPLVYTNRVKRHIGVGYLVSGLIILSLKYLFNNEMLSSLSLPIISISVPIFMLLLDILIKPINLFRNYTYVKEAKQIIDGMPNLIVIGITGSYGKTSVKNFLYKLLSAKYNVLMTPENYNTTLGVVRTIRHNLKAIHDIFICEMGATNLGNIKEICNIVKPKYAIISSIGPQHLESFGSIENVLKTKFELVDSLPDDGIAFLNFDNDYIRNYHVDKHVVTYGIENKDLENYFAYDIIANNKGLTFTMLDENKKEVNVTTKILGSHNITNITGCIAVANTLGIPISTLVQRVKLLEGVPHRLQLIQSNKNLIIDDAYNSNPSGAKSALDTLALFEGIKILITPGMIELGEKQYECNYEFGKQSAKVCDYIVLVGTKQTKPIYDGIISTNYNPDNIIITEDIKDGLNIVNNINTDGIQKIILLENDLPDNY